MLRGCRISCYTDDTALRHGVFESELAFLPKPVTVESLTRKVREVLDANAVVDPGHSSRSATVASTVTGGE